MAILQARAIPEEVRLEDVNSAGVREKQVCQLPDLMKCQWRQQAI